MSGSNRGRAGAPDSGAADSGAPDSRALYPDAPDSGASLSLWAATARVPSRPALSQDLRVDVCVVGAGIAGVSSAYLLAREGRRVAVLDDGPVGGGETGRTTAHLASAIDDRFVEIERLHGPEGARLAGESHAAAIDQIDEIVGRERIDCGFERVDGFLFAAPGESPELLESELAAAQRAGLDGVELVDRAPLRDFDTGPCLRFPRQAQFHPLHYLGGLADAVEARGGMIFADTHVEDVEDGSSACVRASRGQVVRADAVIVATNSPVVTRFAIHTKQAAYRTYVIALPVPRGVVPRALYWDTGDPYHYVRIHGDAADAGELLIVGGEDHKTGQEEDGPSRWRRLEAWARERFPRPGPVRHRWSGQVMEPVDGLAFIGRDPTGDENVFVATGDSGMGMTHGTIAGMLLADLVCGRPNPWARLYDPSRITIAAAGEYARENLNVATRYLEWLKGGEADSPDSVLPGEGAVIRRGATKVAVHRDREGRLHELSAVCTHLGCFVSWNAAEKSWDCPCHGSRFDPFGKVLNGPAIQPLAPSEAGTN